MGVGMRPMWSADDEDNIGVVMASNGDPLTVETVSNHVYFYSRIDSDRCLALIKQLRKLDRDLRSERLDRDLPEDHAPTPIWLHINSSGGDALDSLSTAEQINRIHTPIYSVVTGAAFSGATILSMACSRRYIYPTSFMMIHQLQAWTAGPYEKLKDDMHFFNMLMDKAVNFYVEHSDLSEDEIREILKRDSHFNAKECLELGLVDEIIT